MNPMNNKKKTKKFNKLFIVAAVLAGLIALGGAFFGGVVVGNNQSANAQKQAEEQTTAEIIQSKGVSVKAAFNPATNNGDTYGSYVVTYTVNPVIYTDEIMAKIEYEDGMEISSAVATLNFDSNSAKATVHFKGVFTKRIFLTLYAKSNPDVNAVIHFDFRERITVTLPDAIDLKEGSIPTLTPDIQTTGGTVNVDKTVKNVSYKWNDSFVQWVKDKGIERSTSYYNACKNDAEWCEDITALTAADPGGLTDATATSFFTTKFDPQTWLSSISDTSTFRVKWYDSDEYETKNQTFTIAQYSRSSFVAEFDGTKPIFDYSCTVNGKSYSKSFGLKLNAISVSSITLNGSDYIV
jgi:hypothetical protein